MNMNPWAVSVGSSKGKSRGKITISNVIPLSFGHPMHLPHTFCLLYVESCIELSYDLYISVIVNTHEFLDVMTFTHSNDLIIDRILLLLYMMSINPLCF
jgi:hypothetical protein